MRRRHRKSDCPVHFALEVFGDAWTLLIIRDLMFKGRTTYNEFLESGEGIASNILADRLRKLESAGVVEKRRDPSDARRFIYRLSAKGIDLAPVLAPKTYDEISANYLDLIHPRPDTYARIGHAVAEQLSPYVLPLAPAPEGDRPAPASVSAKAHAAPRPETSKGLPETGRNYPLW